MLNFNRLFLQGVKNTLRVQNGVNFAYKGPWKTVSENTILDEWYVGDFCAAEYTVVVDAGNTRKEIIKALVVAGPQTASVNVYGRTNLNENLIDLTASVTESKFQLIVRPASSPDGSTYDNSTLLIGSKVIFSAIYYYTLNDLALTSSSPLLSVPVSSPPPSSPSPSIPTYTVTPNTNDVDEGSSLTFNVATTDVANATTLYWTVTNADDFATSSGSFIISSNAGAFSVTPTEDTTTEGAETFTASVRTGSVSGTIVATSSSVTITDTSTTPVVTTYTITPATSSVNEGSALTFNVGGTNITNGTYYWSVTNAGDFGTSSGSFTITSNVGSFSVTPTADSTTEGAETFTASVRTGSTGGTIVATSSSVTINDTSTTPVFVPDYTINVVNSGSSAYTLSGSDRNGSISGNNSALAFNNGDKVSFVVNASGHPFWLKTAATTGTGSGISSGVTNNGTQSGTVQWTVGSTGTFYYICQFHGSMVGTITIS